MADANQSNIGRLVFWIMSGAMALVALLLAAILANIESRLTAVTALQQQRGERITILETRAIANRDTIEELRRDVRLLHEAIQRLERRRGAAGAVP